MIVGYSGHLVSADFLERHISSGGTATPEFRSALRDLRSPAASLGPATGLRALVDVVARPLIELLQWRLERCSVEPEQAILSARADNARILVLVIPWAASLDRARHEAVVQARRAGANWTAVVNGTHLRLTQPFQVSSRRHADIDLDLAAADAATAAALLALCEARALAINQQSTSLLTLMQASDRHEVGVTRSLRGGVLDATAQILTALLTHERARTVADIFDQSLTIVYRLLFLFFAEARALVPLWNPVYRESYSAEALRELALQGHAAGLWDTVRAMSRLAHAGCQAGDLRVTAFNGRLFSPSRTPAAERRTLDDHAARRAVLALSTRIAADGEALERISYRDLGVEQLGAVYEALLDYAPRVERTAHGRISRVALEAGFGVRKATGTFYTPQAVVDDIVRETLAPLTVGATPDQILDLRVLDPSMGSGAFLVGACRYLADAYEAALVRCGHCLPGDITAAQRASIRRTVAERCLFGVDVNATAVQLARLSLWLTTLAAERPLTFLDHHLRVGNSLLGTWISRLRTPPSPLRRRNGLPLFGPAQPATAIRDALPARFHLATDPSETAAQVRAKERALAVLDSDHSPLAPWLRIADLWCAAWLANPRVPATAFNALSDLVLTGHSSLPSSITDDLLSRAAAMRVSHEPFHWELEFPEVFFDDAGMRKADAGFDAIIGNPPWDMVRADGSNSRLRSKTHIEALARFAREAGTFDASLTGQLNLYQLFVDRAIALTRPGGRIGLVLPSGIVADTGSAAIRRLLFSRSAVERLVGFDNRLGTFPIHRSVRFVLMTATVGQSTSEITCRFGETDTAVLGRHRVAADAGNARSRSRIGPPESRERTRLTTELIRLVSGEDMSIPYVCSPIDLRILEHAARRFAPLGSEQGWSAVFGRELNASDDRPWMTREVQHTLPVLEGKHIEPFRCAPQDATWRITEANADRRLGSRWKRKRLAYRDVASSTNRTTLIAAILPARTVSTHTLFCLRSPLPLRSQRLLCGLLNSLVVNFLVRLRVSTHVTTAIVERLPIPAEAELGGHADDLIEAARTLTVSHDARAFALLNALTARAYQLRSDELEHVLDSFPLIPVDERTAVLTTFQHFPAT